MGRDSEERLRVAITAWSSSTKRDLGVSPRSSWVTSGCIDLDSNPVRVEILKALSKTPEIEEEVREAVEAFLAEGSGPEHHQDHHGRVGVWFNA